MLSTLILLALSAAPGDTVVARVDGEAITAAMVSRQRENFRSSGREVSASDALNSCVDDTLLAAEGRRRGLAKDPRFGQWVTRLRRAAARALLVEREFTPREPPSESELREMFHAVADTCTFELLVFVDGEAAKAARARIDKGGAFLDEARGAQYARVYPDPKAAPVTLRQQVDPALAPALFAAPPRTVVGPTQVPSGWALARAFAVQRGSDADFAARRASLAERRAREIQQVSMKHVLAGLRKSSGVTLDEKFLREVPDEPTPKQLAHTIAKVHERPLPYSDVYPSIRGGVGAFRHGAGAYRISVAWSAVDQMLLEDLAMSRYGSAPEIAGRTAEFERMSLAQVTAQALTEKTPADKRDRVLAAELERLRKAARVTVDGAALAQAFPPAP